MATKNNPGKYDCYANAEPDEPMFVLLGRDKHAPTLVWLWSVLRALDGEDQAKVDEARACVAQMIEWQHNHGRRAVGIGQAALAGVMDLVAAANANAQKELKNAETTDDFLRLLLARTEFKGVPTGEES